MNSVRDIPQETVKQVLNAAPFLHAYLECDDEIQRGVREMLAIVVDKNADPDDRAMATHTLADAFFPFLHDGKMRLDLEHSELMDGQVSEEMHASLVAMDEEEKVFADRLLSIMEERGLTQSELAAMSGVGQPAISNMLKRQCRPQRRTILKFAEALGIRPDALWAGFVAQ